MVIKDLIYTAIGINIIADSFGYPFEVVDQLIVISRLVSIREDMLQKAQLLPSTDLCDCQGSCGPMTNSMGGDFPETVWNVLEPIDEQSAFGIHCLRCAICRLLEAWSCVSKAVKIKRRPMIRKQMTKRLCLKEETDLPLWRRHQPTMPAQSRFRPQQQRGQLAWP